MVTTRRTFIRSAAALAALPIAAGASASPAPWSDAPTQGLDPIRTSYKQAVRSLAEHLRPRFESGELCPWGDDDPRWNEQAQDTGHGAPPLWRLEAVCRFHLARTRTAAFLVLAASPHSAEVDGACGMEHARRAAGAAAAQDVLDVARRRGWVP